MAGYEGIEVSAVTDMRPHLDLDRWREQAGEITRISTDNGLEILSMEVSHPIEELLLKAFEACAAMGIPIVNINSGGKSDTGSENDIEADFQRWTDTLAGFAEKAAEFGVTLCVKPHVTTSIYDTQTMLRAIEKITNPAFGIDMDPSHIYRAGEDPVQALPPVLHRVKHIHIRDCVGRGPGPGPAITQTCGRGEIDLMAFCKAVVDGGYSGPVCLEVIRAQKLELPEVVIIAAESYGYLNACLKALGAR